MVIAAVVVLASEVCAVVALASEVCAVVVLTGEVSVVPGDDVVSGADEDCAVPSVSEEATEAVPVGRLAPSERGICCPTAPICVEFGLLELVADESPASPPLLIASGLEESAVL